MVENSWKEKARKWYKEAKEDLEKAIKDLHDGDYRYCCFWSQQSIEKLLKAIYYSRGEIRKGHDLTKLLKGLGRYNIEVQNLVEDARTLSLEYMLTRYPNSREMIGEGVMYNTNHAEEILRSVNRLWQGLEKELTLE